MSGYSAPAVDSHAPIMNRAVAWFAFALWSAGIVAGIFTLSRESCELDAKGAAALGAAATGWQVRYWLPAGHPDTAAIAAHLAKQGPFTGVVEEIRLVGDAALLATRMRDAGWAVTAATGDTQPRMEIFAPDGTLRWSGPFRGFEAGANNAMVLDAVVLEKVVRGEAVTPFVPAGCLAVLPSESVAARGPW